MPTYEYLCDKCSTLYEEQRSYAQADAPSRCPECGSPRVRRQLSSFIIFTSGASAGGGGCACSNGGACACRAQSAHN